MTFFDNGRNLMNKIACRRDIATAKCISYEMIMIDTDFFFGVKLPLWQHI